MCVLGRLGWEWGAGWVPVVSHTVQPQVMGRGRLGFGEEAEQETELILSHGALSLGSKAIRASPIWLLAQGLDPQHCFSLSPWPMGSLRCSGFSCRLQKFPTSPASLQGAAPSAASGIPAPQHPLRQDAPELH